MTFTVYYFPENEFPFSVSYKNLRTGRMDIHNVSTLFEVMAIIKRVAKCDSIVIDGGKTL